MASARLLASNRGHGHANRKLARDSTVEFAVALDGRGTVSCETVGSSEAMLLRTFDLPAGGSITIDVLVSGAFTGWRGDTGTFEHWLLPALSWFRSADIDAIEAEAVESWRRFVEPIPVPAFPNDRFAPTLRRSALAVALHTDSEWGAVASSYERGIRAYCWPREALLVGGALDRIGHVPLGRKALDWLDRVRSKDRPYTYWFQKYTIDGWPEWETPALDQSALIPWGLERHLRRTGDRNEVAARWPAVEQAAAVCMGDSGHPGLQWIEELSLLNSAGLWDQRYGAFLYANSCAVAGLRAAARLAKALNKDAAAASWRDRADRIWEEGILTESPEPGRPGLYDPRLGRFLEARRVSTVRDLWTERPDRMFDRSEALDVGMLGLSVPFGLLPASDSRLRATAEAILETLTVEGYTPMLARWGHAGGSSGHSPGDSFRRRPSSVATLWAARYFFQLGRETGDAEAWDRSLRLVNAVVDRLGPLGLALGIGGEENPTSPRRELPGAWELHGQMIETLMDLAGLDYEAAARILVLDPILPPSWPHVGLSAHFACGLVSYRLEGPRAGQSYRLQIHADLDAATALEIGLTCPGLRTLGEWRGSPETETPPPRFEPAGGRIGLTFTLPAGPSSWEWTWG